MFCVDVDGRRVEVWQIPHFGEEAAEDVPSWLVDRLLTQQMEITELGGLQDHTLKSDTQHAIPGDYVVRYKDDQILFCPYTTFASTYSLD